MATLNPVRVGCAGWSLRREFQPFFPPGATHLARYAGRFQAVEINTTFYRSHRPATYSRWAAEVPAGFRFAVKLPRAISHQGRLADLEGLDPFLAEVAALGEKLGPLLMQFPPDLPFEANQAQALLGRLRSQFVGAVVCEPRHPSWFGEEPDELLRFFQVARVAADPAPVRAGRWPGGWRGLVYLRLHGTPQRYHSSYPAERLEALAAFVIESAVEAPVWCIFNNTAAGAATVNALHLVGLLAVDSRIIH